MTICMPELSVVALVVLRARGSAGREVRYAVLPRYARAVSRVLTETRLTAVLETLTGFRIRRLRSGEGVPDYPARSLEAMEAAVPATLHLERTLTGNGWGSAIRRLLGNEEGAAFALQFAAHEWVHVALSAIAACETPEADVELVLPLRNPAWQNAGGRMVFGPGVHTFSWPAWYAHAALRSSAAAQLIAALGILAGSVLRRGLKLRPRPVSRVRLLAEITDPDRLGGTARDDDYWVDGQRLLPEDFALFLAGPQQRRLDRHGVTVTEVESAVRLRGYQFVATARLPVPVATLTRMMRTWLFAWRSVLRGDSGAGMFRAAWSAYLDLAPLFSLVRTDACIYVKFPFGRSDWRRDGAVVTALCRRHGVRASGCQNRAVYARHYEFAFDCHDVYCVWGDAWLRNFDAATKFLKTTRVVGCATLTSLLPAVRRGHGVSRVGDGANVLVFPSDVDSGHYTLSYTLEFLLACRTLAMAHEEDVFQIKAKDPVHVPLFENALRETGPLPRNLRVLDRARHDYDQLMADSDFVIAIGYTSPGVEAMLLGKPTLYYSALRDQAHPFGADAACIVRSESELAAKFAAWRAARPDRFQGESFVSALDPFRDGHARQRSLEAMLP